MELSVDLYRKHKDAVLQLSLAIQNYDGKSYTPTPLTDKAIAEKIGLTEKEAKEIRCIAETDIHHLNVWIEADTFKNERVKRYLRKTS